MKILSAKQIREADAYTIKHEPIASWQLMERAARACYVWFNQHISRKNNIAIFCGKGNNGGDGLALARMLHASNFNVAVFVVEHSERATPDFLENLARLQKTKVAIHFIENEDDVLKHEATVLVDAMIGSGLNKPLRGLLLDVVRKLNNLAAKRIAIDIPTGLFADSNTENTFDSIFNAHQTLTFQCPKRSFLFPEFGCFAGHFKVLDIGLISSFLNNVSSKLFYITPKLMQPLLPLRTKFQHKGQFGHAFVLAGSLGKCGAAILASRAAIKSGAGLVTVGVPECGIVPLQAANPEIMVWPQGGENEITDFRFPEKISALGTGPGMGTQKSTQKALQNLLADLKLPTVLDADALNMISSANAWKSLPKNCILTPHLGELERMLNQKCKGEEIAENAQHFAREHHQILIVKGAHTGIYLPDGRVFFNSSGTNAMATAGSGDVLMGILTGLLAQGLAPENAAVLGVYYHGLAGETAAKALGERAVTASDLIDHLKIE